MGRTKEIKEESPAVEDGMQLKPGTVVSSQKNAYVVMKLLGEGGFGAVYKVHEEGNKKNMYAMKVEKKLEDRKHSKLKMEVAILKLVAQERTPDVSHFTAIVDRGKKEKYFFLIMTLVGKSLDDLKRERPHHVFSIATGLGASYQCLEAIEDLNKWGFIHRDIKPANFACGLDSKKRVIYLLDFGIARRILNEDNELKAPREKVAFKGTVRFASLNTHKGIEASPKDDCESWFYLLLDLMVIGGLPWRKCKDKSEVVKSKEESRTTKRKKLFHGLSKCQDSLDKMLDYIDSLAYSDKVDYTFLYMLLRIAAAECSADLNAPFDWEVTTETDTSKTRHKSSVTAK